MRCQRCQGFMVREYFTDPRGNAFNLEFVGWHCLNCGDVWDAVTLQNRNPVPQLTPGERLPEVSVKAR